jgi:hypothetical protein
MPKRKFKRQTKLNALIRREAKFNQVVEAVLTAKKLVIDTEKDLKLPRSDWEDKLGDAEEYFNELRDEAELKGVKLCGNDVDEWLEAQKDYEELFGSPTAEHCFGECSLESAEVVDSKGKKTRVI